MKLKLPKQNEESVHKQVVQYLKMAYPNVIFRTDGGGLRLPQGLANKFASLQKQRAYPDVFVAQGKVMPAEINVEEHSMIVTTYYGLFLELKTPDTVLIRPKDALKILVKERKKIKGRVITIYESKLRKKGDWFNDHIEEQAKVLQELRVKGYKAEFACGFEQAKEIIDGYLKG